MNNEQLRKQILKDVVKYLTQVNDENEDIVLTHVDIVPCAAIIDELVDFINSGKPNQSI